MSDYIKNIRKKVGNDIVIMPCSAVIVYENDKVLLQKRSDNLRWAVHGGSIEVGEKTEAAAARELLEETGLIANKLEMFGVYSGENMIFSYPNGDKTYVIGVFYLCNDFSGEMLQTTDETLELKWFNIDNLPDDIHTPDIEPLEDFRKFINFQHQ